MSGYVKAGQTFLKNLLKGGAQKTTGEAKDFVGIAKNEEQPTKDVEAPGRTRLYKAFLKRHMPSGTEIIDFTKNEIGFKVPIRTPEE